MNSLDACQSALGNLPKAISGQGGHNATLRAACECVRFGLGDGDALRLLEDWNRTHCEPTWTERELAHKLADARRKAGGQVRTVRQPTPAVRLVWKITRKTPSEPVKPTPEPTAAMEPPRLITSDRFGEVVDSWPLCNHDS